MTNEDLVFDRQRCDRKHRKDDDEEDRRVRNV